MQVRLMCMRSPWSLGIIDPEGHVHLDKLEDHVFECHDCCRFYTKSIFTLLYKLYHKQGIQQGLQILPGNPPL